MRNIFISKDARELDFLNNFKGNDTLGFECRSLIDFKPIFFDLIDDFEVIFFSSIRSAKFLFESKKINLAKYSIACAGPQTALKLNEMGFEVDYIAANASNPEYVSKEFSAWLGPRKVFIPSSDRSLRSVEQFISADQIQRAVVYETLLLPLKVVPADVLVFTSPSNVHAFFIENDISADSIVIAWGHSTNKALLHYGFKPTKILKHGTLDELKCVLESILHD